MNISACGRIISLTVAGLVLSLASADASAPKGHYMISGQTVFDTKTRLTWERSLGENLTAAGAKERCGNLGATLGGSGWRVPTVKELFTIVDFSAAPPTTLIDADAFPQTPAVTFWTTTPNDTQRIQCVNFSNGRNGCGMDLNASRCVR
jgi:hypothetical protein